MILHDLQRAIASAEDGYYRLVLLVGMPQSGKTAQLRELSRTGSYSLLSLSGPTAARLLEYGDAQRRQRVSSIVLDFVTDAADRGSATVILLDDIELLFAPTLALDPLKLLQSLARNRTVVAAWPGTITGDALSYADAAHPEYRTYAAPEAILVPVPAAAPSVSPVAASFS